MWSKLHNVTSALRILKDMFNKTYLLVFLMSWKSDNFVLLRLPKTSVILSLLFSNLYTKNIVKITMFL